MKTTFEKAREFMYRNARPLDLARFQYHFENGSKEMVMRVLSYYQNEDGGFGNAVEADCWNPNSIPLHSNTASDVIREIDFEDADHPVIQGLLNWYAGGKHFNGKSWEMTVESNNDYPHAPWWQADSISSCHTDYNGTAQIAGFIARYAQKDSDLFGLGVRVANEAVSALLDEEITDMHTCVCYMRMAELFERGKATEYIPFDKLKESLHKSINKLIDTDTSNWSSYACKPSSFIGSRESEYYKDNKDVAEYECEYILNTQLEDGSWNIPWGWADYPEEWAVSKVWWKGHGIVQNLLYLKGFGKLPVTACYDKH